MPLATDSYRGGFVFGATGDRFFALSVALGLSAVKWAFRAPQEGCVRFICMSPGPYLSFSGLSSSGFVVIGYYSIFFNRHSLAVENCSKLTNARHPTPHAMQLRRATLGCSLSHCHVRTVMRCHTERGTCSSVLSQQTMECSLKTDFLGCEIASEKYISVL